MALVHEFVQMTPAQAERLRADDWAAAYDEAFLAPTPGLRVFCLPDDVVLRNIGTAADGRKRYFSAFSTEADGQQREGLDYHGLTLLDASVLRQLTAPRGQHGLIARQDLYAISRFRRLAEETLAQGLVLVHYGI